MARRKKQLQSSLTSLSPAVEKVATEAVPSVVSHTSIDSARNKARRIAGTILRAFDKHYRIFLALTRGARKRFIDANWTEERIVAGERILLYTTRVTEAADALRDDLDQDNLDEVLWKMVKQEYIVLLYDHLQPELAETFFNSVFTWLFDRRYYNNANIFVRPSVSTGYLTGEKPTYYSFYPLIDSLENIVDTILSSFDIGLPFEDRERDICHVVEQMRKHLLPHKSLRHSFQIQVHSSLFYRNKAAYIIGRSYNGERYAPFVIALLNNEKAAVYIDALVWNKQDITNLFSFSRAYFMVDTDVPSATVEFLLQMLPRKTAAEIYTSIGLQKQGKSEFYRDFLHHLRHSNDLLTISSGIKGMVMSVFTLPSYPFVFKVINDRFPPPKEVTRETVKKKYQMVKMHDRIGRMADTLEFSYVSLPLARFSKELLDELKKKIVGSMVIEDGRVIIRHLYIERRMTPLNIYLQQASRKKAENAIIAYGNAIREMATANIFPGDLLPKNFGLTRHGRVIFYDYDEIELLTDMVFREIPEPGCPEDEMAAEPWYSIGPRDVFPEQFLPFLFSRAEHRRMFAKHHSDLLDARYWRKIQENIRAGRYAHVFPYAQKTRFRNIYSDTCMGDH